jgi:nucleotide-binding universal stress UspA family protein
MYRNILVPTDGSDAANQGLREAIKLAKTLGARIRRSSWRRVQTPRRPAHGNLRRASVHEPG